MRHVSFPLSLAGAMLLSAFAQAAEGDAPHAHMDHATTSAQPAAPVAHDAHDTVTEGAGYDSTSPYGMAMHDDLPLFHLVIEQLEYRTGDEGGVYWDGYAWYGGDAHRLWLKSEGEVSDGTVAHGRHQIFYGRPITPFFDILAGLRYDLDEARGRSWFAVGVQGLAPYFFDVSATLYASDKGLAANGEASFDLLLTQKWILQPILEIDLYSANDRARGIGAGLSRFESGLRMRYEITRKFAPYIGFTYDRAFGNTRRYAMGGGEEPETLRLVMGLHAWL
ncbi:MAG: copper resistance protein [Pseudomonadota bacterium]